MASETTPTDVPIRDAATLILIRSDRGMPPSVLMGQRGAKAAFMPSKYVFPGGRIDDGDRAVALSPALPAPVAAQLEAQSARSAAEIAAAAIRELWEETGLRLATPAPAQPQGPGWPGFQEAGLIPNAAPLSFIFRAITPPGRPRRFDARFLMAPASAVLGDPEDFSAADDELSHLRWLSLAEARELDLPFITRVVLSEVEARLTPGGAARAIPFFDHSLPYSRFLTL